jgi:alpha-beta hydrolase superfamily lysophospholipase
VAQIDELLPQITQPALILYGDEDPIVAPKGSTIIMDKLGSTHKKIQAIKSQRHGILMENIGNTWSVIDDFLNELSAGHNENVPLKIFDLPREHEVHEDTKH